MNKILDYSGFTNLISLNENDGYDKQIVKDEIVKRLHDGMYNLVQKIAYGENQKEKSNSMYAWVSFFLPKIWNPIDKVTNPENGMLKSSSNLDSSIKAINDCKIKIEMPKEEIQKISLKSFDDLKNLIAISSLSKEDRINMLETIKPLGEKYLNIGMLNIVLNSDETQSFFNLPGIEYFGIKQGADSVQNQFQNIIERRLSRILFENFKNKIVVSSEEMIKPEPSDTAQKVVKSVKRSASAERTQAPVRTRLTTDDLSKWGL